MAQTGISINKVSKILALHTTDAGVVGSDNCFNSGRCDTEKYVSDVNAASLCGQSDWRLPSIEEVANIVHNNRVTPAIDKLVCLSLVCYLVKHSI
jgi:hypothetical protein